MTHDRTKPPSDEIMARVEWRSVVGYEGIYEVSNDGRVMSLNRRVWNGRTTRTNLGRQLKAWTPNHGYPSVTLARHGKNTVTLVHRLVAEAFVPNPLELDQVNHIDGDKTNNRSSNLEWCTAKENTRHAWETGLIVRSYKLTREEADEIRAISKTGVGQKHIANRYGVSISTVSDIVRGITWK